MVKNNVQIRLRRNPNARRPRSFHMVKNKLSALMRLLLRQQRIKSWQMRAVSLRHQTESPGSGEHTKQNQIDPATCFFKYCAAQAAAPRRRLSPRSGRPSAPSPPKEPCKLYKIATQVPLHTSCSLSSLRRNVATQGGASRHRRSPCGFWRC